MIELTEQTDVEVLMRWRGEVLENVFGRRPDAALQTSNRDYFSKPIANGSHKALVAYKDGEEAGCGNVCFQEELPSPDNLSGRCAYIMNIYVRPKYRHSGVATEILKRLIEESQQKSCGKIYLETTEMGRSVYSEAGFREMKDMMRYGC